VSGFSSIVSRLERAGQEYRQEMAAQAAAQELRTFVKIPTLHPTDKNALMYLGEADLVKLQDRTKDALAKLRQQKADAEAERTAVKLGSRVKFILGGSAIPYGTLGTVGAIYKSSRAAAVAFDGLGTREVGIYALEVAK
jgi:hypothetical protein